VLGNGVLDKQSTAVEIARASRHRYVLQQLPSPGELIGIDEQSEAFRMYRIERRLALDGLGIRRHKQQSQEAAGTGLPAQREGSRGSDSRPPMHEFRERKKSQKRKLKIPELKQLIATSLQFPEAALKMLAKQFEDKTSVGTSGSKRLATIACSSMETKDATPGCEECNRAKRQKISEGKEWIASGSTISLVEDECWWVKKGLPKVVENSIKLEPPVKPTPKQTTRGRVRKTQSIAQMTTNRIDSNQGVSNAHLPESKVCCPIHHSSLEGGIAAQLKDNKYSKMTGCPPFVFPLSIWWISQCAVYRLSIICVRHGSSAFSL